MERRERKRIRFLLECNVEGASQAASASRIADLSTTGAFVETATPFAAGERVAVEFTLGETTIRASAEVRYAEPRIGMGIRFLDLDDAARKAIASAVGEEAPS